MGNLFPLPNNTDTSGFYAFTNYVNSSLVDGLLAVAFLWTVFIVTFIASKNFETSKALTIASFISFVISVPLTVINLISPRFMYTFLLLLGGSLVFLKLQTGRIA